MTWLTRRLCETKRGRSEKKPARATSVPASVFKKNVLALLSAASKTVCGVPMGVEIKCAVVLKKGPMKMRIAVYSTMLLLLVSVQTASAQFYNRYYDPNANFYYQYENSPAAENDLAYTKA